jgi:hypothetical protein
MLFVAAGGAWRTALSRPRVFGVHRSEAESLYRRSGQSRRRFQNEEQMGGCCLAILLLDLLFFFREVNGMRRAPPFKRMRPGPRKRSASRRLKAGRKILAGADYLGSGQNFFRSTRLAGAFASSTASAIVPLNLAVAVGACDLACSPYDRSGRATFPAWKHAYGLH